SGSKPQEEPYRFFRFGAIVQAKIIIESHASGQKIEHCYTHAQGRRSNGRNALCLACGKDLLACLKSEKIKPIDININPFQKVVKIVSGNAVRKPFNFKLRIDIQGLPAHNVKLPPPQI